MPTIDATKSGATANSYLDIITADNLADADYLIKGIWVDLSIEDKTRLLITATKQIDTLNVKYSKADSNQSLKFPVSTGGTDDGFASAQMACLYQAIFIYKNSDVLEQAEQDKISGVTNKSIGSASVTQIGGGLNNNISPTAIKILMPFLNLRVSIRRG